MTVHANKTLELDYNPLPVFFITEKVHDPFKWSTSPIRLLFAFLLAQLSPVRRLLHVPIIGWPRNQLRLLGLPIVAKVFRLLRRSKYPILYSLTNYNTSLVQPILLAY